jgi:hypothetical protein
MLFHIGRALFHLRFLPFLYGDFLPERGLDEEVRQGFHEDRLNFKMKLPVWFQYAPCHAPPCDGDMDRFRSRVRRFGVKSGGNGVFHHLVRSCMSLFKLGKLPPSQTYCFDRAWPALA